jgi:hypothetical protein
MGVAARPAARRRSVSFEVVFAGEGGEPVRRWLDECWDVPFELVTPARFDPVVQGSAELAGVPRGSRRCG